MSAKKLLLITVGVLSINTSVHAIVLPEKCATECSAGACRYKFKREQCAKDCPDVFSPDICESSVAPQSATATAQAPVKADVPPVSPQASPRAGRPLPPKPVPAPSSVEKPAVSAEPAISSGGSPYQVMPPMSGPIAAKQPSRIQPLPSKQPSKDTGPIIGSARLPGAQPTQQPPTAGAGQQKKSLPEAQIEMLMEARKQAEVCDNMAKETAKKAAADPQKFQEDIDRLEGGAGEVSIFPSSSISIFDKNPKPVSDVVDYTKLDRHSFIDQLKEQRKTTNVHLARILKDVLDWKDVSKIEKYRLSASGDLRALSSFCTQPIKLLEGAISHTKANPPKAPEKKLIEKIPVIGAIHKKVTGR